MHAFLSFRATLANRFTINFPDSLLSLLRNIVYRWGLASYLQFCIHMFIHYSSGWRNRCLYFRNRRFLSVPMAVWQKLLEFSCAKLIIFINDLIYAITATFYFIQALPLWLLHFKSSEPSGGRNSLSILSITYYYYILSLSHFANQKLILTINVLFWEINK